MKSHLEILFPLFRLVAATILVAPFVAASQTDTAGPSSQKLPQSGPNPRCFSASLPPKFQDLFPPGKSQEGLSCAQLLSQDCEYTCQGTESSYSLNQNGRNGVFEGFTNHKNLKDRGVLIQVEHVADPVALKKVVDSYNLIPTLPSGIAQQILSFQAQDDYLVSFKENAVLLADNHYTFFDMKLARFKNKNSTSYEDALDLLQKLHKARVVAVNFMLGSMEVSSESYAIRLTDLRCLTKLGEEVGSCPFLPAFTEPVVSTSNGKFKADPALDYYALGILLFHVSQDIFGEVLETKINAFQSEYLNTGNFTFKAGTRVGLAFLVCYLLQANREARSNHAALHTIIGFVLNEKNTAALQSEFVYSPSQDPVEFLIFEEIADWVNLRKAPKIQQGDDLILGVSLRIFLWLAAVGALVVLCALYFLCRATKAPEQKLPDVKSELDQEGTDNQVVVSD